MYNGSMYVLANDITGKPILSLQSGHAVAKVRALLINPDTLELLAFFCDASWHRKSQAVLLMRDVREITREGVIIDSPDDIEDVAEIVRLQAIISQKFNLIGIMVVTESDQKLGTVEDYTIDTTSHMVQKLYLKQSILKNLLLNNLVVDRAEIVDVTPKRITVRDATVPVPKMAPQAVPSKPA
jgi:uncharacterized protein YrrD